MPGVVELTDKIEEMLNKVPDKRKKQEYKEWKELVNKLIEEVNKISKFKMYNIIK